MYVNRQHKVSLSRTISSVERKNIQQFVLKNSSVIANHGVILQRTILEYKDLIDGDLKFQDGKIVFTQYNGNELQSSGFSGCLMAAFKFLRQPTSDEQSLISLNSHVLNLNSSYVAHIYAMPTEDQGDTKYKFMQLENSGLIKIEAMFKPFNQGDDSVVGNYARRQRLDNPKEVANLTTLTGSLFYSNNNGGWIANVYFQNKDGKPIHLYKYLDRDQLAEESNVLKQQLLSQ